jgi:hypothetical protein
LSNKDPGTDIATPFFKHKQVVAWYKNMEMFGNIPVICKLLQKAVACLEEFTSIFPSRP